MTRGRHIVRLAGALSLLVLSAFPARAGAQPAPGSANTVTPPVTPAGVSLVSQTTWVRLRTAFQMVLHVDDPALAARPGAAIALRVHQSTDSRSAFDAVIDDGSLGGTVYQPDPLPVATLPRDPHGNLIVRLGLPGSGTTPTLGVGRAGVYPVEVGLTNTGAPNGSGTFVTWLVTVDTRGGSPVANPLAVSFVWQLVADPATMPDGGVDPAVAQQMQPGGRLDRIATILARAGNLPLSLVVGPETALTWQRLAQHDRHYETGLTRLRAAAARPTVQLMPTTYVPIDLTA
ncbi:MAG TPA: hypothetical protein VN636_12990, partial [Acidimicrobiia bacterium]|nr:hypothetical protein [Acidimicrobiia bacterium]